MIEILAVAGATAVITAILTTVIMGRLIKQGYDEALKASGICPACMRPFMVEQQKNSNGKKKPMGFCK